MRHALDKNQHMNFGGTCWVKTIDMMDLSVYGSQCCHQNRQYLQNAGWGSEMLVESWD